MDNNISAEIIVNLTTSSNKELKEMLDTGDMNITGTVTTLSKLYMSDRQYVHAIVVTDNLTDEEADNFARVVIKSDKVEKLTMISYEYIGKYEIHDHEEEYDSESEWLAKPVAISLLIKHNRQILITKATNIGKSIRLAGYYGILEGRDCEKILANRKGIKIINSNSKQHHSAKVKALDSIFKRINQLGEAVEGNTTNQKQKSDLSEIISECNFIFVDKNNNINTLIIEEND